MIQKIIRHNEIDELYNKLFSPNLKRGYFFNSDDSFTKSLLESLIINEKRYGYQACPCRLAKGVRTDDLDIICPCNYRDADVAEYGTCFCGLYVSKNIYDNKLAIKPIPERRISKHNLSNQKNMENETTINKFLNLSYPIWRCEVCGYICARDGAPDTCPICGVTKDRFTLFIGK